MHTEQPILIEDLTQRQISELNVVVVVLSFKNIASFVRIAIPSDALKLFWDMA